MVIAKIKLDSVDDIGKGVVLETVHQSHFPPRVGNWFWSWIAGAGGGP